MHADWLFSHIARSVGRHLGRQTTAFGAMSPAPSLTARAR